MRVLPCPHCGITPQRSDGVVDYWRCPRCGLESMVFYDGADLALKSWNLMAVGRHPCPWRCRANQDEWDEKEGK